MFATEKIRQTNKTGRAETFGKRNLPREYSSSKPRASATVIARPQYVAVAISSLRMVKIASLRLLGAKLAMTDSTILYKREANEVSEESVTPDRMSRQEVAASVATIMPSS